MPGSRATLMRVALFATLSAIGWMLLWETVVAPLQPGGSLAALKCLPLMLCVPGLMRDTRRARQWLTLLLPWYFAEALVRALTGHGRASVAASVAAVLVVVAFASLLAVFRVERRAIGER
jgi:uncharacterized membrane protein